jgi:hypothetical protein
MREMLKINSNYQAMVNSFLKYKLHKDRFLSAIHTIPQTALSTSSALKYSTILVTSYFLN